MNEDTLRKNKLLRKMIKSYDDVVVALSGGTDSCFLLKVAKDELKENVLAITIDSPFFLKKDIDEAKRFVKKHEINHKIIPIQTEDINTFLKNKSDRCYHCKRELFKKIKEIANEKEISIVIEGSNRDDTDDYRPGLIALKELGIISPLKEVGLTKNEIRFLSKKLGIKTWDKPSSACLASRIPYNSKITISKLRTIEQAENFIHYLGIKQCRVRHHNTIARIEVLKKDSDIILKNAKDISKKFKSLGFKFITLDINGYRTGSLNEGEID